MKDLSARTRTLFAEGMPLAKMVDARLSVDLEMFSRGGLAVLDAIEAMGCDTLHRRPAVSKMKQARLLGRTLAWQVFGKNPKSDEIAAAPSVVGAQQLSRPRRDAAPQLGTTIAYSYAESHREARAAHSNFYHAFFLLPKPSRAARRALYTFMPYLSSFPM